jgi:biotin carboxylase
MKKLLILGANPETIPLIETAKAMSIFTIVTDPDPNAPAKKFADKAININGMDVDGLVKFCKEESIDGVLVGVADRLIEPYQKVCEGLNLPCYGNQYQCEVLTNKGKFNNLCKQYQINTIPSTVFYKNDSINNIQNLSFPIFIKPIDRNSGKGMSVAYDMSELKIGIEKAFNNTNSDYILLERYMVDCKDILVSYTIVDGEPILSAMGDRYTTKEQNTTSQVCLGVVYPSNLLSMYMAEAHPKMVKLLKDIGLKNAILTISAFVEDGNFYYYDPGFRLQGEAPNLHMENINNFDQKTFLINIAMGNQVDRINITKADFESRHNSTIWFLLKAGKINKIEGFEQISKDPCIFHISKRLSEGDIIESSITGTEAQVLARIYLSCDTKEDLKVKVLEIQNTIKVFDIDNNNQLLKGFSVN